MYTAYKLNKQGDNIHPWRTPFPIWNQSVVPCPVLIVASWPKYRFLRRQVRWSGILISFRIFHSLWWSTQQWQPTPKLLPGKSHGYTEDSKDTNALPYWRTKEPEIKLPTSAGSSKKQENSRKTSISVIDYAKACVDHNKLWKILREMGIPDHLICLLRNLYAGQAAIVRTGHGTTDRL